MRAALPRRAHLLGIPAAERAARRQDLSVIGAREGSWAMAELSVKG